MPYRMSNTIQAVVIGDNIYVGGELTLPEENSGIVMVYSLATGSWRTLPSSETMWFGMAVVNNVPTCSGWWQQYVT